MFSGGSHAPGTGDLWAMLQPLFFGLGFWRIEKHMSRTSNVSDAQAFTGAMMLFVLVFFLIGTIHDFVIPLTHESHQQVINVVQKQFDAIHRWKVIAAIFWTGIGKQSMIRYMYHGVFFFSFFYF